MIEILEKILEDESLEPAKPVADDNKKVYTVAEIQQILGVALTTTYSLIKTKQFHSVKIGSRVLVSKKSFDEWLQM